MDTVLQDRLPVASWADPRTRRLPGTLPLDMADWLQVDEAYAGQMALRDRLIAEREAEVHAVLPQAEPAAREVHEMILPLLPGLGFRIDSGQAVRPDGVAVPMDAERPLLTLGRLVQEDICLMQPDGAGQHMLTGAILCFPAGWRLDEKLGQPMGRIHVPVKKYTEDVARRVQRLMDAIRPETPMWRANAHHSRAPLFNPLSESHSKDMSEEVMPWIRSERQCLIRLPRTGAVVFTIHTFVVPLDRLTPEQTDALVTNPVHRSR